MKVKCPKCDWQKTYPSSVQATAGLKMHTQRAHGGMTSAGGGRRKKRKYTKRKLQEAAANLLMLNYCPGCGLNLQLLNRAATMAAQMR